MKEVQALIAQYGYNNLIAALIEYADMTDNMQREESAYKGMTTNEVLLAVADKERIAAAKLETMTYDEILALVNSEFYY